MQGFGGVWLKMKLHFWSFDLEGKLQQQKKGHSGKIQQNELNDQV
jgi:hypothetical protein